MSIKRRKGKKHGEVWGQRKESLSAVGLVQEEKVFKLVRQREARGESEKDRVSEREKADRVKYTCAIHNSHLLNSSMFCPWLQAWITALRLGVRRMTQTERAQTGWERMMESRDDEGGGCVPCWSERAEEVLRERGLESVKVDTSRHRKQGTKRRGRTWRSSSWKPPFSSNFPCMKQGH